MSFLFIKIGNAGFPIFIERYLLKMIMTTLSSITALANMDFYLEKYGLGTGSTSSLYRPGYFAILSS